MKNHYNCIYMYINKINGKRYIGQTNDFIRRHMEHKKPSTNEQPIDRAFNKYGTDNFEIIILAENLTQEQMNEYEKFFIKRYNTLVINDKGYNIAQGGNGGNKFEGWTEEQKQEYSKKCSERLKGEKHPLYGTKASEETKQKKSASMKKYIQENGNSFKGKHHTDETKDRISKTLKENGTCKGANNPSAKAVICIETGEVFQTMQDAAKWCGQKCITNIAKSCKGKVKSAGKHPITGEKLHWKYYKD